MKRSEACSACKVRELAEKLRELCDDGEHAYCPSLDSIERILRAELEPLFEFCSHGYECAHWHAWNERNKKCDCGLAGWSKRFK